MVNYAQEEMTNFVEYANFKKEKRRIHLLKNRLRQQNNETDFEEIEDIDMDALRAVMLSSN